MDRKTESDSVHQVSGKSTEAKEIDHHEHVNGLETNEKTGKGIFDLSDKETLSGKFENPLAGVPKHKLFEDVSGISTLS